MRKMAQKMIAIAVAMVIVLGMASVTQMDTLAASYSFEGEAHVQTYGDRAGVYRNNTLILGTTGQAKRLERIKIKFNNQTGYDGSIEYRVHRQTYGWTNWVKNNQFAGTKGGSQAAGGNPDSSDRGDCGALFDSLPGAYPDVWMESGLAV